MNQPLLAPGRAHQSGGTFSQQLVQTLRYLIPARGRIAPIERQCLLRQLRLPIRPSPGLSERQYYCIHQNLPRPLPTDKSALPWGRALWSAYYKTSLEPLNVIFNPTPQPQNAFEKSPGHKTGEYMASACEMARRVVLRVHPEDSPAGKTHRLTVARAAPEPLHLHITTLLQQPRRAQKQGFQHLNPFLKWLAPAKSLWSCYRQTDSQILERLLILGIAQRSRNAPVEHRRDAAWQSLLGTRRRYSH